MTTSDFVRALKEAVVKRSQQAVENTLISVPGRRPAPKLLELSNWYNALDESTKQIVNEIIGETVEQTTFNFLCILDGVSAIEDSEIKGHLELNYVSQKGEKSLLNDPEQEYLHDLL